MRILSLLILLLSIYTPTTFAQRALDFTIQQPYVSPRALGMGNAFTAVVDDHSSVLYNPAALAKREDGHLRMFLGAGLDPDYLDLIDDIDKASSIDDEEAKLDEFERVIRNSYGKHYHARLPTLGAMWARPNWGMAFIPLDLSMDIGVHQQIGPMLNVNAYLDTTLAYGYARHPKWFGNKKQFALGATVKAIHRVHASEAISAGRLANDTEIFDKSDANEGMTIDFDIGTLYTPDIPETGFFSFLQYMKPTFAVVVRNVVDYGFSYNFHLLDKNSGKPPDLQRRFDFGSKWELPQWWVFQTKFAADIRDVGHSNWTLKKGSHFGFESYWKMFNWWKGHWSAGLNQGYWTAGFGARFGWFQIDLVSYGEEVGTASVTKESRRYVAELSLDF